MNFSRFCRYCVVGAAGTITHYSALLTLVWFDVAGPVIASSAGAIVGSVINYQLNYNFTFKSHESHANAGPKFFVVAGVGLLVNWLIMMISIDGFGIHYLIAQCAATALVVFISFVANARWSFKSR